MIEFISYNGSYPALCHGKLVVKIDGREVSFGKTKKFWGWEKDEELADYPRFWRSGGGVGFDEDWIEFVDGPCDWEITGSKKDYPPEIWKILPDILRVMNENVEGGCCGGCV